MRTILKSLCFCLLNFHCPAQITWPPRDNLTQEQYLVLLIDSLAQAEKARDTSGIINYASILTTEFQLAAMKDRAGSYLRTAFQYAKAYSDPTWYAEVCNRAGILVLTQTFRGSYPWNAPKSPHLLDSAMYWHRLAIRKGRESGNTYAVGSGYRYLMQYSIYQLSFRTRQSASDSIPYYYEKAKAILGTMPENLFDLNTHYAKYLIEIGNWQKAESILNEQYRQLNNRQFIRRANFLYVLHDYIAQVNQLDTLVEIRKMLLDNYEEQIAAQHNEQLHAKDQQYEVSKTKNILEATSIRLKATNQVLIVFIVSLIVFGFLVVYLFFLFRKNKKLSQRNKLLLREQNHRVKNNLQMISSLLSLQSQKLLSTDAKDALQVSQSRIHSVALLHRMLYEGENVGNIEVTEYIRSLTEEIRYSAGREIQIDLDLPEKVEMKIETVTSLGLIVNELLINSIKHVVDTIPLRVSLHVSFSNGVLHLIYSDNGPGAAPEVWMSSESFGNQLIRMQSKQLKGEYEVSGDKSFRYELKVSA